MFRRQNPDTTFLRFESSVGNTHAQGGRRPPPFWRQAPVLVIFRGTPAPKFGDE